MTIYGKGIFRNIGKIALYGKNDKFSAKNLSPPRKIVFRRLKFGMHEADDMFQKLI